MRDLVVVLVVMLSLSGVAFAQAPMDIDARVFGANAPSISRVDVVERHIPYIEAMLARGTPLHAMTRHMLGLFNTQPGGRAWRRILSEQGVRAGAGVEVVRAGLAQVSVRAEQAA